MTKIHRVASSRADKGPTRIMKTVRMGLFVLGISFLPAGQGLLAESSQDAALDRPARPIKQVNPEYPMGMSRAGIEARVVLRFVVNKEGRVVNPYVFSSNNPWFDRPALDAILQWRFEPGLKGGTPVNVRVEQPLSFSLGGYHGPPPGLWVVSKSKGHELVPIEYRWEKAPVPVNTEFPVYPFDALLAGIKGKTNVRFIVGKNGRVIFSSVIEATEPELGDAVLAMIATWKFEPARDAAGAPCFAVLTIEHDFAPSGSGHVPVLASAREILRLLKKSPERITPIGALDSLPKPVSQRPPVFPTALLTAAVPGSAMIEFFIDREGDVQLPHVISASAPEFGYAAVQAVATWRFTEPKAKGKPAIARARIPVKFELPDTAPPTAGEHAGR